MSGINLETSVKANTPQELYFEGKVIESISEENLALAGLPKVLSSQLNNSYISITSEMFEANLFASSILGADFNQTHVKLRVSISWLTLEENSEIIVPMGAKDESINPIWRKLMAVCSYPLDLFSDEEISGLKRAGKKIAEKHANGEKFSKDDFPKLRAIGDGDFIFQLGDSYKGDLRITKICLGTPDQRNFFGGGMGATPVNGVIERTEKRPVIDNNYVYNPEASNTSKSKSKSIDLNLGTR